MKELHTSKFHLIPTAKGYKLFSYNHLISKKVNKLLNYFDEDVRFSKEKNVEAIFQFNEKEAKEVLKILNIKE